MPLTYHKGTDQEFSPIPDAVYDVQVTACEEKYDRNGNPYFSAQLKIVGAEYNGRMIFANYIGAKSIGPCLVSCAVVVSEGAEIEAHHLLNLRGRVRTRWEEYNEKWSAKIAAWVPPHRERSPEEPLPAMAGLADPGQMPDFNKPPPDHPPAQPPPDASGDALDDIPF